MFFFLVQGLQALDHVIVTFDRACKEHVKIKDKTNENNREEKLHY